MTLLASVSCTLRQNQYMQNRTCVLGKIGEDYVFTIKADRFLRNMVRSIVGTLLQAGRGRLNEEQFRHIIAAKNRSAAGESAPAHALFLENVEYPEVIWI